MKIVIDISDTKYKWIVNNPQTYTDELHEEIRNGTPLPKNHGRLIDADAFCKILKQVSDERRYDTLFSDNLLSVADVFNAIISDLKGTSIDGYMNAPTIIEADGGGAE